MIIEVESISKPTMIKPSSPTPDNLKHYELSFLDQISSPVYNPMVFFYHSNPSTTLEKVNHLKKSLSQALTLYYPLAGRVNVGNAFVDCSDQGVPFLEARVACTLSALLADPDPAELNKLVPFELDRVDDVALGVQVNVFACGGVGVGVCLSHKLGDGLSFFTFVRAWAKVAFGEVEVAPPQFVAAELFPARNIAGYDPNAGIVKDKDSIVTKRFVFTASSIADLKQMYSKSPNITSTRPPSRVESLSSFIYSRLISATDFINSTDKQYVVVHAVNLRPRTDPPLPERSFGNLYRVALTFPSPDDLDGHGLVGRVRASIAKIDDQYVKMLQKGSEHLNYLVGRVGMHVRGEAVSVAFTSLCRFPVYETDFGWGGPAWVGSLRLTFKNLVFFVDTKVGGGIEAYINLEKSVMSRFEEDEVFRGHVSPSTSVDFEVKGV